ncbi:protein-disulfide reductase DsbD domain-containing protein [Flavivirga abyssicola]|uniref:protein-disulfide reductase DsbD domain-containing protein n=1 Tax=Flavivirga abyssicola TaxID=3063533 RepID=UPI0026E1019D|nr:protein-disulfide reductase DsbD domain-containing protein [Flavivirga sp. MEBiC07777]WVK14691.1 protein-disulfide reductase DsbD domain-containing protein [Flavivirga sp. MEBiC07777]
MKKIFVLVFLISSVGYSQILDPVKWSTSLKKVSNLEYDLIINATIKPNYHLYSLKVPKGGPLPTVFIFEDSDDYELVGTMTEDKGHTAFDPIFELHIKYFENTAKFKQRIKLKAKKALKVTGEIEFMTCNDASCVPGYDDFEIAIQ